MKTLDLKLFRDLKTLKIQTATVALLVICGVSLLVSAWSAYRSLESAKDTYYSEYKFGDIFADLKKAPVRVAETLRNEAGIAMLEDRIVTDGLVKTKWSSEPAIGRFISIPNAAQPLLNKLHLRQGHLPSYSNNIEILVHEGFANAHHLKVGDSIDALIQGQNRHMEISGIALSPEYVYALSPSAPLPDDLHFGVFWVPRKGLEEMAGMSGAFNNLTVKINSGFSTDSVKDKIDQQLKSYGNRGSFGRDRQQSNMFVQDEIRQQRSSAIFSPAIFLGIAGFLVHIISSRLITLHRPQIATMKALGYSSSEIFLHYLKLIFAMMIFGAIPGLFLGGFLGQYFTNIYQSYFRFPTLQFSLDATAALLGLAAGTIPGILGAFSSIRAAAKLQPAEAMRPPNPPAFHFSVLDRMGFQKKMNPQSKLVWRNLFFRPGRLAFVILGISMAVAVIIASSSWSDMISYLLNTQFQKIQREDISVSFIQPETNSGLRQLLKLPGVLSVEAYRNCPIRIRFLNHKREILLVGWPENAHLRQLLDNRFQTVSLPSDGILLSRFFEKNWNLKIGQKIRIETLEGPEQAFDVVIAGFTDDLLGNSASIKIQNLWRLLKEQESYNSVMLKVDSTQIDRLYTLLQNSPKIGSVNIRKALFNGLESTFGKIIRESTLVLILFALAIATGIVYNSVRVSFSERAWELASLRVMGFDKKVVFGILLNEIGLQSLLAIAPGCLLGLSLVHLSIRLIETETFGFPVVISLATYAAGILVVLLALSISSWSVYQMIKKLNLAEALKARE